MNENKIEIPSGGMIKKPVGMELASDEKEIFAPRIDYYQILKWIKTEHKKVFSENLRKELKRKWYAGEISIEELRHQKRTIDKFYKIPR